MVIFHLQQPSTPLILHILYCKFYAPKISFARTMAEAITLSMS